MVAVALESTHFLLPVRIRSKKASADALAARLALAERLADLPDIKTVEDTTGTVPWSVEVHLQVPAVSIFRQPRTVLFCCMSRDGIGVHGLSDRDRYQVLSRGWGKLARDGVLLYHPRDAGELDVCWDVLQRARRSLIQSSAQSSPARSVAWAGDLPRFSRTTLC